MIYVYMSEGHHLFYNFSIQFCQYMQTLRPLPISNEYTCYPRLDTREHRACKPSVLVRHTVHTIYLFPPSSPSATHQESTSVSKNPALIPFLAAARHGAMSKQSPAAA